MERVYLDYNIYDKLAKGTLKDFDRDLSELNTYISVAHLEEYYNAKMNDKNNENLNTLNIIEENLKIVAQNKGILNPSETRIINKKETIYDCLDRIKKYDTRNYIAECASDKDDAYKEITKSLAMNDKSSKNNSNLFYKDIWDRKEVVEQIDTFPKYLEDYNEKSFVSLIPIYGVGNAALISNKKKISPFKLQKDCFKNKTVNFAVIECVIEFLQDVLNKCNYHRDKGRLVKSGIYDTEHAIYASYCTKLVTEDSGFRERINAIYYYLGFETRAVSLRELNEKNISY